MKQKLKKRGERESLSGQFERVRALLQLGKATKAGILEKGKWPPSWSVGEWQLTFLKPFL